MKREGRKGRKKGKILEPRLIAKNRTAREMEMTKTTTKKDEKITISLHQVMEAVKLLLAHAEANGLREVTLGHDWYWRLPSDDAFDMVQPCPDALVGDLYDDAEIVRDITLLKDSWFGLYLSNVAVILDYIGSEYPSLTAAHRERAPTSED